MSDDPKNAIATSVNRIENTYTKTKAGRPALHVMEYIDTSRETTTESQHRKQKITARQDKVWCSRKKRRQPTSNIGMESNNNCKTRQNGCEEAEKKQQHGNTYKHYIGYFNRHNQRIA